MPSENWKDKSRNRVSYLSLLQVDRLKITHVIHFSLMLYNLLFGGHSSFPSGKIISKIIIKKIIYSLFNVMTMQEKENICILKTKKNI